MSKEERKNLRHEIAALEHKTAVLQKKLEHRKARLAEMEAVRKDKRMKKVIEEAHQEAARTVITTAVVNGNNGPVALAGTKVTVRAVNPLERTVAIHFGNPEFYIGAVVPASAVRPLTNEEMEALVKERMAEAEKAFADEERTRAEITQKMEALPDDEKDMDLWEGTAFIMDRISAWNSTPKAQ